MYEESGLRLPKSYATLSDEEMECDGGKLKLWAKIFIAVAAVALLAYAAPAIAGLCGVGGAVCSAFATGTAFTVFSMALFGGFSLGNTLGGGMTTDAEDQMKKMNKLACEY